MERTSICRNGPTCKYYAQNICQFRHPALDAAKEKEKEIGGFSVSSIKHMARSTMNDEEYYEFERACDKGASESLLVMMLYTADQRHDRLKKEMANK